MNSIPALTRQTIGRYFFAAVTLLYGALFLLWRLLVESPLYEAWWLLQVSEIFGMASYLPAPLLLPGAIALRHRVALIALTIPLLWFGAEYGALFLPSVTSQRVGDEADILRVMTWNTMGSIGFESNAVPELMSAANRVQPDLIFLQEAGSNTQQQLQALADEWPYQIAGFAGGRANLAIASKWQFTSAEIVEDRQGCHCIRVEIAWKERVIDAVAVHVVLPNFNMVEWHGLPIIRGFDATHQLPIFDALLADLATTERPLLMVGDFNTNERQPNYARLVNAGLYNAHDASGWGFGLTFPRPGAIRRWWLLPVLRIDHVFYNDDWGAIRTWTGFLPSSDHLYMVADLEFH